MIDDCHPHISFITYSPLYLLYCHHYRYTGKHVMLTMMGCHALEHVWEWQVTFNDRSIYAEVSKIYVFFMCIIANQSVLNLTLYIYICWSYFWCSLAFIRCAKMLNHNYFSNSWSVITEGKKGWWCGHLC